MKPVLIKLKNVIGTLYKADKPTGTAVIVMSGAPGFGDTGRSNTAKFCNKIGIDYFAPDYIGFCRSDGTFSFENCVRTIHESIDFLKGKTKGVVVKTGETVSLGKIKKVVLYGNSFGGSIAPFADLLGPTGIEDVVLVAPLTDYRTMDFPGTKEPLDAHENMMSIGMKNIYRGYSQSEFPKIAAGKMPELNPIENQSLLKGKNVYVFHGNKDKSIRYQDSVAYVEKLKASGIAKKIVLKVMPNFGHSSNLGPKAMEVVFRG